jgi:hypothetical protein
MPIQNACGIDGLALFGTCLPNAEVGELVATWCITAAISASVIVAGAVLIAHRRRHRPQRPFPSVSPPA